jgi:hypothetical protein
MDVNQKTHTGRISEQRKSYNTPPISPLIVAAIEAEAGDTFRLRLVTSDSQEAGSLAGLAGSIKQKGHPYVFADVWQGKHVLVISKLSRSEADNLVKLLEDDGHLSVSEANHLQSTSSRAWNETLKRDSLKWSGRFAMAASAAVAAAGIGQKDWNRAFTGLGFMTADSIVATYGNGKGSIDFDGLFRDMNHHFEANGVHLPHIANPEQRLNTIQNVHHFIATHPVELSYSLGMLGGIGHIRSGLADFGRSRAGISRITKGVLGAGGSAAVVFLDEDKSRNDKIKSFGHYLKNPSEIPQGITDVVLASPIRFKGIISTIYSGLYLTDSLEEKKKMKDF